MADRGLSEKHGLALLCAFFAGWAVIRAVSRPPPATDEAIPFSARTARPAGSAASGAPPPAEDGPVMTPPEPAFKRDAVSLLSRLNESGAGGPPALMGASASASAGGAASASAPKQGLGGGPSWQMPSASGGQGASASAIPSRGPASNGSRLPSPISANSSSGNGANEANGASSPGGGAASASRGRSASPGAAAPSSGGSAGASAEALGGPDTSGTRASASGRPSKAELLSAARGMTAMAGGGGGGMGGGDSGGGGGESFGSGGPTAPKPKKDGGASGGGAGGKAGAPAGSPRPKLHHASSSGSGGSGGDSGAADPEEDGLPVVGAPAANFKLTGTFYSMEPNTPATVQTFKTPDDKAIGFTAPSMTVCGANDCVADASKDKPLDPGAIPFIVVPNDFGHGVAKGDYAAVTYGGKTVFAIVGDPGPKGVVGKGSIKLARPLNIPATSSGTSARVTYVILPGSKDNPLPTTAVAIKTQGEKRFLLAGVPIR